MLSSKGQAPSSPVFVRTSMGLSPMHVIFLLVWSPCGHLSQMVTPASSSAPALPLFLGLWHGKGGPQGGEPMSTLLFKYHRSWATHTGQGSL